MSIALNTLETRKRQLEEQIGHCKDNLKVQGDRFLAAQQDLIIANSELIELNCELLKLHGMLS